VRKRVQRGQLAHEKDRAGRVRIILDSSETLQNESPDTTGPAADELADELRDRIRYLERQVEEEREARRRADTILAQLSAANAEQARTIRALEAPREGPEDAETVEEATDELGAERARRETAETTMHEGRTEERRRREAAESERDELRRELHARGRQQGAHEAAEVQQGRGQPQSATGGVQERTRRPWWRRMLGR
jgi:hypothetical protein